MIHPTVFLTIRRARTGEGQGVAYGAADEWRAGLPGRARGRLGWVGAHENPQACRERPNG